MGESRVRRGHPAYLRNRDRNKDELASCGSLSNWQIKEDTMTNIEYIAAYITLINIIFLGVFALVAGVIIAKELKYRFKPNQEEKHKST